MRISVASFGRTIPFAEMLRGVKTLVGDRDRSIKSNQPPLQDLRYLVTYSDPASVKTGAFPTTIASPEMHWPTVACSGAHKVTKVEIEVNLISKSNAIRAVCGSLPIGANR